MTAVRRHGSLLLLAIRGAGSSAPDGRAELDRVVALVDALEHDVLPFEAFDAAMRFLVLHALVEAEGGQVFSLSSPGFAATAGTAAPTLVDEALALVAPRLESLSVDGLAEMADVVDRRAYEAVVREHVRPPVTPSRPTPPTVETVTATAPRPTATAAKLAGIVVAGAALGVVGLPAAAVVIGTAGVGSAIAVRDLSARRVAGALARVPAHELAAYPSQVPAERVAVGGRFQFRLLPPTSRIWARGLLCIASDRVRFVSADERRADRDWEGPCDRLEVQYLGAGNRVASIVRVHHPDGQPQAQFVVQGRFQPPR